MTLLFCILGSFSKSLNCTVIFWWVCVCAFFFFVIVSREKSGVGVSKHHKQLYLYNNLGWQGSSSYAILENKLAQRNMFIIAEKKCSRDWIAYSNIFCLSTLTKNTGNNLLFSYQIIQRVSRSVAKIKIYRKWGHP